MGFMKLKSRTFQYSNQSDLISRYLTPKKVVVIKYNSNLTLLTQLYYLFMFYSEYDFIILYTFYTNTSHCP